MRCIYCTPAGGVARLGWDEVLTFEEIGNRLGWSGEAVVGQIADWVSGGVIRRFGAVVNHRRLGFGANGMAVFRVSEGDVDAAGERLGRFSEISHCYRRPPLPGFPYGLFAMVHGRSEREVRDFVERMAGELELPDYTVLFSTTEYKKASMKYFLPAEGAAAGPHSEAIS